jgi:ornithine cyclodeaminase/alanine dehydrogenase-like protein (mu-crystallin family)
MSSDSPLLLTDDDVRRVLTMNHCLAALDDALKQEGTGTATTTSSSAVTLWAQSGGCEFVSMQGVIRNPAVIVQRIRSHALNSGQSGTSMLMLFSGVTGELSAVLSQGLISAYRVGATAGLAAREMARTSACIVGIIGSGRLARAHALAYAAVRNIEHFKVFSRDPERRNKFAAWIGSATGVRAEALDNPEAVVRGSDIVATCTSANVPVVQAAWLDRPGLHLAGVQFVDGLEIEPGALGRFYRLVTYLGGLAKEFQLGTQVGHQGNESEALFSMLEVIPKQSTLPDVLLGKAPGRQSDEESNYFLSHGAGVQFAAVASLVYERARARGLGRPLPKDLIDFFRPKPVSF